MGKRTKFLLGIAVIAALILGLQVAAFASHPEQSLPGSNFEIDTNANLKVDDAGTVHRLGECRRDPEERLASGQGDNSYCGGSKEDDPVRAWAQGASRTTRAT